jgi:uncharacterized delta-60 repeat protein
VVAGTETSKPVNGHIPTVVLVVRYSANGAPDAGFGPAGDGTVTVPPPAGYAGWSAGEVAVQTDGQIVVGGQLNVASGPSFGMTRLNGLTGTVDTGYGTAGWAIAHAENSDVPATRRSQTVALEPDGRAVIVGWATRTSSGSPVDFAVVRFLASAPQIGSFTATPNPVTSGTTTTLTASNITDNNPGATVTQVAFYVMINGSELLLGYGTHNGDGSWSYAFDTTGYAAGSYTLYAQATDSDGALGDPTAFTLTIQ